MYVYQADTYCDACGAAIAEQLAGAGLAPADPDDLRSFDSDDYPKPAIEGETDGPDHCASAGQCLAGIPLADYGLAADATLYGAESRTVGEILSDGLTEHGASYLLEMLDDPARTPYQDALHRLWRETFAEYL